MAKRTRQPLTPRLPILTSPPDTGVLLVRAVLAILQDQSLTPAQRLALAENVSGVLGSHLSRR